MLTDGSLTRPKSLRTGSLSSRDVTASDNTTKRIANQEIEVEVGSSTKSVYLALKVGSWRI